MRPLIDMVLISRKAVQQRVRQGFGQAVGEDFDAVFIPLTQIGDPRVKALFFQRLPQDDLGPPAGLFKVARQVAPEK